LNSELQKVAHLKEQLEKEMNKVGILDWLVSEKKTREGRRQDDTDDNGTIGSRESEDGESRESYRSEERGVRRRSKGRQEEQADRCNGSGRMRREK